MTDLLTRLRQLARAEHDDLDIGDEAAEEIVNLRTDVHVLREMLERHKRAAIEAALQSQDREDALRYQWLRKHWFTMSSDYTGGRVKFKTGLPRYSEATEKDVDAAIDHARRVEENK